MSNTNQPPRAPDTQPGVMSRLGLDKSELKSIKVAIMRRNVSEPNTTATPLLRNLEDPSQLIIHYRPDEGVRPIFDREDVIVNKENQEERMVLTSPHAPREKPSSHQVTTSRSSSRSSQSSVGRSSANQDKKRVASPQPHTSRDYRNDNFRGKEYSSRYCRSNSTSRKAVYKTSSLTSARSNHTARKSRSPYQSPERSRRERTSPGTSGRDRSPRYYIKQKRSRSPSGYKGSRSDRRSRSSSKFVEQRRSPYKHRRDTERKMSRSPHRSSRGRSRSYSPHHRRSRYSRSPHRHTDYRGYERTKRSRSRSPRRRRYTPERNSRRSSHHDERIYQPPRIPNPYFEAPEFWIPDPMMQPRFIPRQMIPPGAFPYAPFRPPILPPRAPFRPRIVYNRPLRPKVTSTSVVAMIESSPVTTTSTTEVAKNSEKTHQIVEITGSSSNELEHSTSNKKDDESLEK